MPCCKAETSVELRVKGSPTSIFCWAIATSSPDTLGDLPQKIPRRRAIASSCSLVSGGTERVSASFFRDIFQNILAQSEKMCQCRVIVNTDYIDQQADNHDSLHYPAETSVLPSCPDASIRHYLTCGLGRALAASSRKDRKSGRPNH